MADYLPQASTTGRGHEANTLVVKSLITFAVLLVAVCVVVDLCLVYVMKDFSQEEKVLKALAPPAFAEDAGPLPAPRLQAQPPADFAEFKEAELRRLNGYGWVDRKAGIAHIPIDRAIDIAASTGLAAGVGGGATVKAAEATPAPRPAAPAAGQGGKP